ncbi:adiponectin-like [Scyliorhinus canicula]|uniref:adiponectin-like n=1 Tax=Scyliorhinus canicula TaxID=7830 RepID=UPI0018F63093|nr:adiponectin-like [Scyliorhinus canicula]
MEKLYRPDFFSSVQQATSDDDRELLKALVDQIAALEDMEHEEKHDHHAALFAVSLSQDNVVQTGVTIVYNQVSLNREEGYNSTTGVFICPIAGVYFFTYSCLPAEGVETSVAIFKNGDRLSSIDTILPDGSTQQVERSELILLQKGDNVYVMLEVGSLLNNPGSLKFTGYRISD